MTMFFDKFYKNSDACTIYVCRVCGNRAIVNEKKNIYRCKYCEDSADICAVKSSWSSNLVANEISSMNVKMNYKLAAHSYPVYDHGR